MAVCFRMGYFPQIHCHQDPVFPEVLHPLHRLRPGMAQRHSNQLYRLSHGKRLFQVAEAVKIPVGIQLRIRQRRNENDRGKQVGLDLPHLFRKADPRYIPRHLGCQDNIQNKNIYPVIKQIAARLLLCLCLQDSDVPADPADCFHQGLPCLPVILQDQYVLHFFCSAFLFSVICTIFTACSTRILTSLRQSCGSASHTRFSSSR